MPRERNSKKRNSLSDALTTVRPTFKAPSTAKRPSPSPMSPMPPGPRTKSSPAPPAPPAPSAPSRTFPAHSEPLSLAFKRQVLSTARAYLSEKQEERRPGDRLGLRCAVLASRRTSKASRFIRNLKENAIEQKLLAVEKRMQHMDGDETSGPDQMLDEACQLAAQLHELSNNDSINLEIGQIAESITVCTDLLNNLRATGLSHTLHLEQIAEDLNGVHEGHGISKALLSELQKDIAAMRAAIEAMKIGSGTVAPVVASSGCPTSVDLAESMCPLLESLEERTSLLLSEMGEAGEASIVQESDLVSEAVCGRIESSEAENFSEEMTTDAGPSFSFPASTSRVEEFLSESASRWMAHEDSPSNCQASMAATRSEPSRLPWDDCDGGVQGDELDAEPVGGGTSFPTGGVFHAHSDGHVLSSQSDLPSDGLGSSKPWRQRFHGLSAAEGMRLRLFGCHPEDTASGHRNVDVEAHEGDGGDRAAAVLPSYFEADAGRMPRLLHGSAAEKMSTKAAGDDAALPSPFFPTAEAVHGDDGSEPASESSGRTSEGEFLFRSLDLPMFLGDLQRERHLHRNDDVDRNGDAAGGGYGPDATAEWSLKSLGPEEWEVMALCLHCPGQGAELRRRLLEPIGFWPRIEESATPVGPVGPILLLRPDRDDAQRRASHASLASVATAKWGMDSYLRRKRRSTLPQILGLPPQAVKA